MASVPMESVDVEAGYADIVALLTRDLAKARVENSALRRYIEGEDERFWARHADVIRQVEEQAAADAAKDVDVELPSEAADPSGPSPSEPAEIA